MIGHVRRTGEAVGHGRFAEDFSDQWPQWFAQYGGDHGEAAPVHAADDDLVDAQTRALADDRIEGDQKGFGAAETKQLAAGNALVEAAFEGFGAGEKGQHRDARRIVGTQAFGRFGLRFQPATLLHVVDVAEFPTDRAAIGALEVFDEGGGCGRIEPVLGRGELGDDGHAGEAEGIEARPQEAARAIGFLQREFTDAARGAGRLRRCASSRSRLATSRCMHGFERAWIADAEKVGAVVETFRNHRHAHLFVHSWPR